MSLWVLLFVAAIACLWHAVVNARRVRAAAHVSRAPEVASVQGAADARLAKAVRVLQRSRASVTPVVQHQPSSVREMIAAPITTKPADERPRGDVLVFARPATGDLEQATLS